MKKINIQDLKPKKEKFSRRVFLVEDDRQLKRLYINEFRRQGVGVEHFETGFELLSALEQEKPDAILLDILTPGLRGLELLEKLKNNLKTREIPVLTYSALVKKMVAEKALKLGAKEHLGKSDYTPQEVVKKVLKYIK